MLKNCFVKYDHSRFFCKKTPTVTVIWFKDLCLANIINSNQKGKSSGLLFVGTPLEVLFPVELFAACCGWC